MGCYKIINLGNATQRTGPELMKRMAQIIRK
jgi:hypothetical protein